MNIVDQGNMYVTWSDGARTSWASHLVCTCIKAKMQQPVKNCCKHIVEVIRKRMDTVATGTRLHVPIVLPKEPGEPQSYDDFVDILVENNRLYAFLPDKTLIGAAPPYLCRLDVRAMLVPYLINAAFAVQCTKCQGYLPSPVEKLKADRTDIEAQLDCLREACHWLWHSSTGMCREHDDSELIPF